MWTCRSGGYPTGAGGLPPACRSVKVGRLCKGAAAGRARREWADYDERSGNSVSIMGLEWKFEVHREK
jgi:hypothetical protein